MSSELKAISYTSEATRSLSSEDLDALLVDARAFNASTGVTGALFYSTGKFFQYIEGPADALATAYRRIKQASSHRDIHELHYSDVSHRQFGDWHMALCQPATSILQRLANADWEDSIPITRSRYEKSEGLALALYHWNKWQAEKTIDS